MGAAATSAETGRLHGVGDADIFWQTWQPASAPQAVVLIAHGAGEHSSRYAHVAERLNSEGYAVFALDHRGHGHSSGPRALITRMDDAVADLDSLTGIAAQRHPGLPLFLLGHSMGGTIALRYAVAHGDGLRGLILSGPLAALEEAPLPLRLVVPVLSAVVPRLGVLAVDPALVSRDPAVVEAYRNDPLVHHGKLPARTIAEIATTVAALPVDVERITVPTLIAYGTADRLCPPSGSVMLSERIGAPDKTVQAYDGLSHEVLNEPEQDAVMDDVCAWLRARTGSR